MTLVIGRGKNRKVIELPCGEVVKHSIKVNGVDAYRQYVADMIGIMRNRGVVFNG